MSVDDALSELDKFLDIAIQKRVGRVVLIHGHGTGTLRRSFREHLAASPYIDRFRPGQDGEGGDGVTVAQLAV